MSVSVCVMQKKIMTGKRTNHNVGLDVDVLLGKQDVRKILEHTHPQTKTQ